MPSLPNWTTPLVRLPGWEQRYVETLERHNAMPFEWGVSDCIIVACDLADAMCGRNPLPLRMRKYRTAEGAHRRLLSLGFRDIEAALAAVFPRIPTSRARRGDCGVLEQGDQLACLIVTGPMAVGKGPEGPVSVPVTRLKSTFAIGAP